MKKFFAILSLLSCANVWANSTPIEPVLVPIANKAKGIDIHMGKYEVTVAEFLRFATATDYQGSEKCALYNEKHLPSDMAGKWNNTELIDNPYKPIVCIGPLGAIEYAKWLADTTGKPYRLPESSEWQYAASEGKPSRFAFGDDYNDSEVCNYENIEDEANSAGLKQHHNYRNRPTANCNDGAIYQTVVGMYRPNRLGLHDMMGNVREFLQTCSLRNKKQPERCQEYVLAGSGWHWMPRPTDVFDSMGGHFVGSIEGFRLVLDSPVKQAKSRETQTFADNLLFAQQQAKIEHNRLKSLPTKPSGLDAILETNNQVSLKWLPSAGESITYTVYRSYLDPQGQTSRKAIKIAEGIKSLHYIDHLPNGGAASYAVLADNIIGQSQASNEVSVGKHQVFQVGKKIQAELYSQYRNTQLIEKKELKSVFFDPNIGDNMPKQRPFAPSWLTYQFSSERAGQGMLTMNIRGQNGAIIEFWQDNHLIATKELTGAKDYVELRAPAQLIAGNEPIQIRAANQQYFILDWFKLNYQ